MSTDSIRRQFKAGADLADRLNREFCTQRATRKACEVERRLAICRKCPHFRANDCAELELVVEFAQGDGEPVSPTYVELLTRVEFVCRLWQAEQSAARNAHRRGRGGTRRK